MDSLYLITKPIEEELALYKSIFNNTLVSDNILLNKVLQYIVQRNGKCMRPILMLLIAKKDGTINHQSLHAAASVELLHTASLVHDDVVDNSEERRGQTSINSQFGNKVAVLSGDFLLSTSLCRAANTADIGVVDIIAHLGCTLAQGELLQLSNIQNLQITEETYYQIIKEKTDSL